MSELLTAATWLIYLVIGLMIVGVVAAAIAFPFWLRSWREMRREMEEMKRKSRLRR